MAFSKLAHVTVFALNLLKASLYTYDYTLMVLLLL